MLCVVLGFDLKKNMKVGNQVLMVIMTMTATRFAILTMCQKPLRILNHVFSRQLCGVGTIIILILHRGLGETLEGTGWRIASRRSDCRAMFTRQSKAHHATVKAPG